jgi:NifU-like protein
VAIYPLAIEKRFAHPAHVGGLSGDVTTAIGASFVCGSFVEISLVINHEAVVIEHARFRTNGCGFAVAGADVLCSWLSGKRLADLHGLDSHELSGIISAELGAFPPERGHCEELPFDALRKALRQYRERRVEEFQGDRALVCSCFGISEDSIEAVIEANGFTNTDQVADVCRAGSGCGSCRMLIQEMIDSRVPRPG